MSKVVILEGSPKKGDKDEWNAVAPDILTADAVIFAAPVYWFGWNAQAKAALDRMFCFLSKGDEARGKKCALFMAAVDGGDYLVQAAALAKLL